MVTLTCILNNIKGSITLINVAPISQIKSTKKILSYFTFFIRRYQPLIDIIEPKYPNKNPLYSCNRNTSSYDIFTNMKLAIKNKIKDIKYIICNKNLAQSFHPDQLCPLTMLSMPNDNTYNLDLLHNERKHDQDHTESALKLYF